MRYGFVIPGGTAAEQLDLAEAADRNGWDGVFVWEAAYGLDAWSLLAAMSQRTSQVRLGTMLTPLPWRRPWKVASQAATLDTLSSGRAILAVGLGAVDFVAGDDPVDARIRAARLDDGLEVLRHFWENDFAVDTPSYQVDLRQRAGTFVSAFPERPRVPIWCVGKWPHQKSMRRVLGCDGLIPHADDFSPAVLAEMVGWLEENERREGFDVIQEGTTPADDPASAKEIVRPWAEAGATWWLEAAWHVEGPDRYRTLLARIEAGPPSG